MTIARAFVVLNLKQASVLYSKYTHTHTLSLSRRHRQSVSTAGYMYTENRAAALLLHCLFSVSTANETRLTTDEPDTDSDSDYLPYNG